jgi:hypothetical protein
MTIGARAKKEILCHWLGRTAERMQPTGHGDGRVRIDWTEMDTSLEKSRKPVPAAGKEKNRLKGIPPVGTQMSLGLAIKIQTNVVINGHLTRGPHPTG